MNKSERKKLANIVCGMMYSFNSRPDVVSAGKEILHDFPSIGEELASLRIVQAEINVRDVIISTILRLWDPNLFNNDIRALRDKTCDAVDDIFNFYLYSMDTETGWNENILSLEDKIGSVYECNVQTIVSDIICSESWGLCVAETYAVGTPEYNYLTFKKES